MKIRPRSKYILIELTDGNERKEKGIYIPQTVDKKRSQATIKALGSSDECAEFNVGDKIFFNKLGIEKVWDNEALIHVNSVLCTLEEE